LRDIYINHDPVLIQFYPIDIDNEQRGYYKRYSGTVLTRMELLFDDYTYTQLSAQTQQAVLQRWATLIQRMQDLTLQGWGRIMDVENLQVL